MNIIQDDGNGLSDPSRKLAKALEKNTVVKKLSVTGMFFLKKLYKTTENAKTFCNL